MSTAYQWKTPGFYPVSAQTAADEINRIYQKHGELNPSYLVDESRAESAPLHGCFEWRDDVAAEEYRKDQARHMMRNITVVSSTEKMQNVRAFVSVQKAYHPISVVLKDEERMRELLETALRDLRSYREKYKHLAALKPVFDALDTIVV